MILTVAVSAGLAASIDMIGESGNGPLYAAVATAIIVSVLAPIVNGGIQTRKSAAESLLRQQDAKAAADLARAERRQDIEDLRLATLAAKEEARQSAEQARIDAKANIAALAAAQAKQQEALLASTERIADASLNNTSEIAVIKKNGETAVHLADGALTASLEAQLWALKSAKNSHELLLAYRAGTDDKPTPADFAALAEDVKRIVMLEAQVATRHEAMKAVAAGGAPTPQPITVQHASIVVAEAKPLEVHEATRPAATADLREERTRTGTIADRRKP